MEAQTLAIQGLGLARFRAPHPYDLISGRYRLARKARHDRVKTKSASRQETRTAAFLAVQTMHLDKNQAPLRAPDLSRLPSRTSAADVMMASMVVMTPRVRYRQRQQ